MKCFNNKKFHGRAIPAVLLATVSVASLATPGFAAGPVDEPAGAPLPRGATDLQVAIDAETGDLVPAPPALLAEIDAETAKLFDRSAEGLVAERRPDGGLHVDLTGRFMSAALARIEAGGEVTTTCVESVAEAAAFLAGADAPSVTAETADAEAAATPKAAAGPEVR